MVQILGELDALISNEFSHVYSPFSMPKFLAETQESYKYFQTKWSDV